MHFSTTDLRNKLSKGYITNNHPIITLVTSGNNVTIQVRVEIYSPAQPCWHKIWGHLHKEMNLCIKASYYDSLSKNNLSTMDNSIPDTPNLTLNQCQVGTILTLRKSQAKAMLNTLSTMSSNEANECKNWADASTQALKAYYQQPDALELNFNEALHASVTLIALKRLYMQSLQI